jgi:drug/metabolite transporter (DMT)-like permease
MLLASVTWALYTILGGSLSRRYSPLKVTALGMLTGTPFLILLSANELLHQQWTTVSMKGWVGVCYSFLLAGVVSFVVWDVNGHKVGNTRTAIFSNLVPVVAVTVRV